MIDDSKQLESIPLPEGMERISDDDMLPDEIPLPETKPKICIQVKATKFIYSGFFVVSNIEQCACPLPGV